MLQHQYYNHADPTVISDSSYRYNRREKSELNTIVVGLGIIRTVRGQKQ